MKKLLAIILAAMMLLALLAACGQTEEEPVAETSGGSAEEVAEEVVEESTEAASEPAEETAEKEENVTIRLGGLKGPTSMGMVKLFDDADNGLTENTYEYTIAGSADELTPLFLKGELDILAVPANLGSILYNNADGAVQTLAINTLGVIYIVEKGGEEINSIADLAGQTIYTIGKGSTTEYALNYLLEQYGLNPETDVTVEWKTESTEIVAQMATMDHAVAMIPQPFVTVAQTQIEDLRVALDMTEVWDALDNGSQFITATLIVRKDFAEAHPEELQTFLEEYAASTDYINENVAEGAALVEKYDIVTAAIAEKAIPYCNMVCITGEDMKASLTEYLNILYDQSPDAVGGTLPGEDFYIVYE